MPAMLVKGQDAQDVAAYVAAVAAEPGQDTGALAAAVAAKVTRRRRSGSTIFTGVGGCGSCHTLAAAGTTGTVGPNLEHAEGALARPPASQQARGSTLEKCIETAITDPYKYIPSGYHAGIMPNTFSKTLSPSQIQALVAFLSSASHSVRASRGGRAIPRHLHNASTERFRASRGVLGMWGMHAMSRPRFGRCRVMHAPEPPHRGHVELELGSARPGPGVGRAGAGRRRRGRRWGRRPAPMARGRPPASKERGRSPARKTRGRPPAPMEQRPSPAHTARGRPPAPMEQRPSPARTARGRPPAPMELGRSPAGEARGRRPALRSRRRAPGAAPTARRPVPPPPHAPRAARRARARSRPRRRAVAWRSSASRATFRNSQQNSPIVSRLSSTIITPAAAI